MTEYLTNNYSTEKDSVIKNDIRQKYKELLEAKQISGSYNVRKFLEDYQFVNNLEEVLN